MHSILQQVTQRISARSQASRQAYLQRVQDMERRTRPAQRLGCANVAHAVAALPAE